MALCTNRGDCRDEPTAGSSGNRCNQRGLPRQLGLAASVQEPPRRDSRSSGLARPPHWGAPVPGLLRHRIEARERKMERREARAGVGAAAAGAPEGGHHRARWRRVAPRNACRRPRVGGGEQTAAMTRTEGEREKGEWERGRGRAGGLDEERRGRARG